MATILRQQTLAVVSTITSTTLPLMLWKTASFFNVMMITLEALFSAAFLHPLSLQQIIDIAFHSWHEGPQQVPHNFDPFDLQTNASHCCWNSNYNDVAGSNGILHGLQSCSFRTFLDPAATKVTLQSSYGDSLKFTYTNHFRCRRRVAFPHELRIILDFRAFKTGQLPKKQTIYF